MSSLFLIRAFAFLVLPLLLAGIVIAVDKSVNSRERRLEIFLIYMFAFSAAGGIAAAMGHLFASDVVAEAIGWPEGSPFQLEMGFANLAMGVLAAIAVGRRDGFREATVIGGAILSVGAFTVHVVDIVETGNLAPGNTLINITNLGRPALLIYFLWALRREERSPESEGRSVAFAHWQGAQAARGGTAGAFVGIGLGIGMAVGQPLIWLVIGLAAGLGLGHVFRRRALASPPASAQTPSR
jgi:4-amino-4-deoxy-L-arabinose transferase-like glycosyltransferase